MVLYIGAEPACFNLFKSSHDHYRSTIRLLAPPSLCAPAPFAGMIRSSLVQYCKRQSCVDEHRLYIDARRARARIIDRRMQRADFHADVPSTFNSVTVLPSLRRYSSSPSPTRTRALQPAPLNTVQRRGTRPKFRPSAQSPKVRLAVMRPQKNGSLRARVQHTRLGSLASRASTTRGFSYTRHLAAASAPKKRARAAVFLSELSARRWVSTDRSVEAALLSTTRRPQSRSFAECSAPVR